MLRGEVPELRRVLLCQALLQQGLRLRRVLPRILEDWDVRRYIPVLRSFHIRWRYPPLVQLLHGTLALLLGLHVW